MSTLTLKRHQLTQLRKGDRIVAIDGREVAHTVKENGARIELVNPTGSGVEWVLYPDTQVQSTVTIERKDRRSPAFQRRTRYGLSLYSRNGGWETLDGQYRIQEEEAITFCDAPHPVRTGRHEGYYCEGNAEHAYAVWTVFHIDDADVLQDGIAGTFDDAWEILARHLAK